MKIRDKKPIAAEDDKETNTPISRNTITRREFLVGSAAVGVTILLPGGLFAAGDGKKTFTILHTNDMHASFIGMGPASDYTPFTLNDDTTRGGYARLAGLIAKRKEARKGQGPVLVLDAGDYSMGTAFSAATRETGGELHLMGWMGYDATTFGNHEFDLGPDGLGKSIGAAVKAGRIPAVLAANTSFPGSDATLADLQRLAKEGVIRRYLVIERGGIRFGIFGTLGKEAMIYTSGGATTFADPTESAREVVKILREKEKVDVVIALSHGGVVKGKDGRYTDGEDVRLARDVPGIDVVISGHSHTELQEAIIVNGRTPVVQTGKESRNLGELVITAGRRQADGRFVPAPSDRRHHRRRPGHRRRDRRAQEVSHRSRVRVARVSRRPASGHRAARFAQYLHGHRRRNPPGQPRHRLVSRSHEGRHRVHRQRHDARRSFPREDGRADRLRCICRGAPRLRGG